MVTSVKMVRRHPDAIIPTRGSANAVGLDLYSMHPASLPGYGQVAVDTGVAFQCPPGTYARIAPRSGLACGHGMGVGAGVVDPDFRGSVVVLLFNHSPLDFQVGAGDRVAQVLILPPSLLFISIICR